MLGSCQPCRQCSTEVQPHELHLRQRLKPLSLCLSTLHSLIEKVRG